MKSKKYHHLVFLLLSTLSLVAHSNVLLNGSASYQDLGTEVFIGSLSIENPSQSSDAILASAEETKLQVVMLSRISKRRWVNMWMQSIAINNSRTSFEQQAQNLVDLFEKFKGPLLTNDIVEITYTPKKGTTFSLNSVILMNNDGKNLLNLFLRTWIGSVPPSTQFKDLILGKSDSSNITKKIAQISPSTSRKQTINQWLVSKEEKLAEEKKLAEEQQKKQEAIEKELLAEQITKANAEAAIIEAKRIEAQTKADAEAEEQEALALSVESILAQQEYTTTAVRTIYGNIRYPRNAASRNQQGTVRVNIVIQRTGEIVSSEIIESSGFSSLDQAALKAIKKTGQLAPIPEIIDEAPQQLLIPISFRLAE